MNTNTIALSISNLPIRQDEDGRFSLNDLHKASGNLAKHKPSEYLRNQQAKDLVSEIELEAGNPAIKIIKGRGLTGTYACKELVYAYAMWISPSFTLKVIHAYDSLGSTQYGLKELPEPPMITTAQQGELFTRVKSICGTSGKIRAAVWSRFQNHFHLNSYKNLPLEQYDDSLVYLDKLKYEYSNGIELITLTTAELDTMVADRLAAFEGELLPRQEAPKYNSIMINLAPLDPGQVRRWIVSQLATEAAMFHAINSDQQIMTLEEARIKLIKDGYIVMKEADILNRLK